MLFRSQQVHRITSAITSQANHTNLPGSLEREWKRSSRLPAPSEDQIQQMISCYAKLRQDRPQSRTLPPLTKDDSNLVLQSLRYCAKAVRTAKQEPQLLSLNKPLKHEDSELGDLIPDSHTNSPLVAVAQEEFLSVQIGRAHV